MQENNAQIAKNIIDRLKKNLKVETDTRLAEILNIKPNTISSWKKRNTLDYSKIIDKCVALNIDLNLIFNDSFALDSSEAQPPIISKNLIYQYTNGELKKSFSSLPKMKFPWQKSNESLAFQTNENIINQKLNSDFFAISEKVSISDVVEGDLVVIISQKLGFFIKKVNFTSPGSKITFTSIEVKNTFNKGISIQVEDIDELWKVTGLLSLV